MSSLLTLQSTSVSHLAQSWCCLKGRLSGEWTSRGTVTLVPGSLPGPEDSSGPIQARSKQLRTQSELRIIQSGRYTSQSGKLTVTTRVLGCPGSQVQYLWKTTEVDPVSKETRTCTCTTEDWKQLYLTRKGKLETGASGASRKATLPVLNRLRQSVKDTWF